MSPTSKPNLYALLVGISVYNSRNVPNLSSDADAKAMKAYLEDPMTKSQFGKVEILPLYDAEATKANIVKGFQEHLSKAQAGDTALFFFGGHGVRETTSVEAFKASESDGKITGIVCVDTEPATQNNPQTNTLSDKEMRYLIRRLAHDEAGNPTAHVVTIFDCCHSGSASRSIPMTAGGGMPANSRQLQRAALPDRSWEGFIFHDDREVNAKIEEGAEIHEVLPQGNHIMFSACRDVELAWEKGGRGNFTKALIDVLEQNKSRISYHELHSRVKNRMRFQVLKKDGVNDQRQTPQLYLNSPNKANRYNLFLSNQANDAPTYGVIEFNEEEKEWRIDVGALQGVPLGERTPKEVDIFEGGAERASARAKILNVFPSHSTLEMPRGFRRDRTVSYRGMVQGLGIPPLKVFLRGEESEIDAAKTHIEKELKDASPQQLEMVQREDEADYTVLAGADVYDIVLAFDHNRPRTRAVRRGSEHELYSFLLQIAKWTFLRDLERTGVFKRNGQIQPQFPIEFKAFQLDPEDESREIPLEPKGNVFTIDLSQKHPTRSIRFEIHNRYHKDLYVGLAYMEHNFGFDSLTEKEEEGISYFRQIRDNPFSLSKAGASDKGDMMRSSGPPHPANGKRYTKVGSGAYIATDNWIGYSDHLKLIVSEVDFDIQSLHMPGLPRPHGQKGRADFNRRRPKRPEPPKWEMQTFEIFVANPEFQPE